MLETKYQIYIKKTDKQIITYPTTKDPFRFQTSWVKFVEKSFSKKPCFLKEKMCLAIKKTRIHLKHCFHSLSKCWMQYYKTYCKERQLFTISYALAPEKYVIKLCNRSTLKEIWFVLWYKIVSFWGIIVMCDTKYLNKYNKLWHFAKYLGKSFSVENNLPKSFSSLWKWCFNFNFIIVIPKEKYYFLTFFSPVIILNVF